MPVELLPWIAVLVACGVWLGVRLSRAWRTFLGRRRQRIGVRGERVALQLLKRLGYRILRTQAPGALCVRIDGTRRSFDVRADALVSKRRRTYVAEFKTGQATSIDNRATRRQLLEYALAYDVDGVLLVDATRGNVHAVEFQI